MPSSPLVGGMRDGGVGVTVLEVQGLPAASAMRSRRVSRL